MESEQQFHTQSGGPWRSTWIVALIIVVAVVVAIFLYFAHNSRLFKSPALKPAPVMKVDRSNLASTDVPDKFPPELIILESGASVIENYNASAAGNRFQAARSYQTDKPLAEVDKMYKDFFDKNGWIIENIVDDFQQKVITATKGTTKIIVSAEENAVTHVRTVTVSATILKTAPQSSN